MEPDTRDESQLLDKLRVMREHWRLIVACVLLTTAAAIAYSVRQTEQYEAESRLLIREDDLGNALVGLSEQQGDPEREAATNLKLVEQPMLAARVLRDLRLDVAPDELLDKVEAEAEGNSSLLAIKVTDESPSRARRIANAYAEQYIAFRANSDRERIQRAREGIEDELTAARRRDATPGEIRTLRREAREVELLASLQTGNAEVIQPATEPSDPVSPKPVRDGLLGLLFGLVLGVALAFLRDRLDPRLKDEYQVGELLDGVPTIANIPKWRNGGRGRQVEIEGFRSLRTTLASLDPDGSLRSLLITSPGVGEGKTTASLNLSLAMAERGESVLLLEADLRRRGLSERLGLQRQNGLSNVLRGQGRLHDYLIDISLEQASVSGNARRNGSGNGEAASGLPGSVSLVPAGPPAHNSHALLGGGGLNTVLADAGVMADKVVVDGTPVGLVSDVLPIAKRVDGVVVVVRLHHSRRNEVRRLLRQLEQTGIAPLGLVLFGTTVDRSYHACLRP